MSNRRRRRSLLVGALCALAASLLTSALLTAPSTAAPWRTYSPEQIPTDRVIVKWRESGVAAMQIKSSEERTARLSQSTGVPLSAVREIHDRLDVVRLDAPRVGSALRQVLARLSADTSVQYAEPDERRYALGFPDTDPNDPRFAGSNGNSDAVGQWEGQWYLKSPTAAAPAAIDATTAWKTATGAHFVIAIIDTGIDAKHPHPDLGVYGDGMGGKLLPGYDFICNDAGTNCTASAPNNTYLVANDGDGWDSDATDPGDWISAADLTRSDNFFTVANCGSTDPDVLDHHVDSSWHGTRVAGIAAAITNNGQGVAGVAPDAYLLPVRVLGKCSGYVSDIVAGMYWAAGLTPATLNGVTTNQHPAQVLNLSIGGRAPCSQTEQEAVTAIVNAGHLVVVAAGNDGGPVLAPANCQGALSVAGIRHIGTKVGYSNVSSSAAAITIAAPAGNCVNDNKHYPWALPCLYSIETTSNDGHTAPGSPFYTYSLFVQDYKGNVANEGSVGTSFAAPIVSGVAALMIQANPNLTANQLIARLQAGATPFPAAAVTPPGGVCHVAALTKDASDSYNDIQKQECQCTATTCGAGMLNAAGALAQALYPVASITTSTDRAALGESVTLDGSTSTAASLSTIAAYQWTTDSDVSIANASSAIAKLVFPALRPITVTLRITDSAGRQDVVSKTINSVALSAGGGGGALDYTALFFLGLVAATPLLRRRNTRHVMLGG